MNKALFRILVSAGAVCAAQATPAQGFESGSLWLRPAPSAATSKIVEQGKVRLPVVYVCQKSVCTITIRAVKYPNGSPDGNGCDMEVDPEVLVVTKSQVKIRWVMADQLHHFGDGKDIEFKTETAWKPSLVQKRVEIDLDWVRTDEVQAYNIQARLNSDSTSGCKIDPLIVNTG